MRNIGVGDIQISDLAKKYVADVLDSNRLSYGPYIKKFEAAAAEAHECDHGVFVSSGTTALHMALAAMKEVYDWEDGDEVIVPALTFISTASIVMHCGMTPVLVDVCPLTYNIDLARARAAITPKTRAIIPVHMHGVPADMAGVMWLARQADIRVLEDACEAWFSKTGGHPVCSFGDVGCLSTYVAHTISAGTGGLALTNNSELESVMRSYKAHGLDFNEMLDEHGSRKFLRLGHNFRCSEMEAAIGLAQFEQREEFITARRRNVEGLAEGLSSLSPGLLLSPSAFDDDVVYMTFPITCAPGVREPLREHLRTAGIGTRKIWTLPESIVGSPTEGIPVTMDVAENGFFMGCHQYLTDADIDYMVETVKEFFSEQS